MCYFFETRCISHLTSEIFNVHKSTVARNVCHLVTVAVLFVAEPCHRYILLYGANCLLIKKSKCLHYLVTPEIHNLSLNETIDVAQNRPLWKLMSTFGAMHS